MSYRYFASKHPKWPKKIRELVGRTVQIAVKTQTRGGRVFECGERYKVAHTYRGKLVLEDADGKIVIRALPVNDVELVIP